VIGCNPHPNPHAYQARLDELSTRLVEWERRAKEAADHIAAINAEINAIMNPRLAAAAAPEALLERVRSIERLVAAGMPRGSGGDGNVVSKGDADLLLRAAEGFLTAQAATARFLSRRVDAACVRATGLEAECMLFQQLNLPAALEGARAAKAHSVSEAAEDRSALVHLQRDAAEEIGAAGPMLPQGPHPSLARAAASLILAVEGAGVVPAAPLVTLAASCPPGEGCDETQSATDDPRLSPSTQPHAPHSSPPPLSPELSFMQPPLLAPRTSSPPVPRDTRQRGAGGVPSPPGISPLTNLLSRAAQKKAAGSISRQSHTNSPPSASPISPPYSAKGSADMRSADGAVQDGSGLFTRLTIVDAE
jgi:hypothetical protein